MVLLYLSSFFKKVGEVLEAHYKIVAISLALLLAAGLYVGLQRGYGDDVQDTIQRVTDDNRDAAANVNAARGKVADAQRELDQAADSLDRATARASELQSSNGGDKELLDDCTRLVTDSKRQLDEAKRVLADIDQANQ